MILNILRPNPGGKAQTQEEKRTKMLSAPSSVIPARFPAPRRGPQSAAGPHRQHSRRWHRAFPLGDELSKEEMANYRF